MLFFCMGINQCFKTFKAIIVLLKRKSVKRDGFFLCFCCFFFCFFLNMISSGIGRRCPGTNCTFYNLGGDVRSSPELV